MSTFLALLLGVALTDSEPKIVVRKPMHYVGIRTTETMPTMATVMPRTMPDLKRFMLEKGLQPAGPEFIRFHAIDMSDKLELEVGLPVAKAVKGSGRVHSGVLPGGRYAMLIHTGHYKDLYGSNTAIQEWGKQKGLPWDVKWKGNLSTWGGRIEFYLTDPDNEPNPDKWQSELWYRIQDPKR